MKAHNGELKLKQIESKNTNLNFQWGMIGSTQIQQKIVTWLKSNE